MKKINGKVVYVNVGPGCWGIVDENGKEYRPLAMPEQLKTEGAKVRVVVKEVEENFSVFMWGTTVRILSFHTLDISN